MKTFVLSLFLTAFPLSPTQAAPLDTFQDCDTCPEMIELPMGEFLMGAPEDEFRRNTVFYNGEIVRATPERPHIKEDEGPQHIVTIDIPIAMGKNEVTYGEWMACVEDGGCNGYIPQSEIGRWGSEEEVMRSLTDPRFVHTPSEENIARAMRGNQFLTISSKYPVLYVSYLDAQNYIAWLNAKLDTNAYRLPTEAEWEYAARAGTTTRFAQGFEPSPEQVNFNGWGTESELLEKRPDFRTRGFPVPVDEMDAANGWGLRHMSGNALELTLSCYTERYSGWTTSSEWLEKSTAARCIRTTRGGGQTFSLSVSRVAWRGKYERETTRTVHLGFRVIKELN